MKGQVAVITGAGKGIGRDIALKFARRGARLAVCSRTQESIDRAAEEFRAIGANPLAIVCDVGDETQVKKFVEKASEITGRIDVLVNNAGVALRKPLDSTDLHTWEETIRINLTGAYLMTKYALTHMGTGSHIFMVGSNASKTGFPNWSAYCASKWGLLGFTNSLREEVRSRGIRVTSVLPGPTRTTLWDRIEGDWDREKMMDPESIAEAVLNIYDQPQGTLVEEIFIIPQGGSL